MTSFPYPGSREFSLQFDAFADLQSRSGSYTSKSSVVPSDGTVLVMIREEENAADPMPEQLAAIQFVLDHPEEIKQALYAALPVEYAVMKEAFDFDPTDKDQQEWFPEINAPEDFANVFGVGNVFVFEEHFNGTAYIGLECGCTWDDEHGLGFVLHQGRVVAIGQADTAFGTWAANDDIALQTGEAPVEDPVAGFAEGFEELTEFVQESTELQAKARAKLEEVKSGKQWWAFWR